MGDVRKGFEYVELRLGDTPPPSEKCPNPEKCPNLEDIRKAIGPHQTVQAQCPNCHRLVRFSRVSGVS